MTEQERPSDLITVTINGIQVETKPGRLLIDVAEESDVFVPRFCYHPGLESVAACRMCLVQVEGSRRPLDPACATTVTDGMVVNTKSSSAVEAQDAVLEMLLINHPLDCPICDRGGECPLQDQTMKFGPGKSRYSEEKRHYKKALPISDLVMLDRERCVLCWRCVRFSEEIAGDPFIDLMDRGSHTQINTASDKPFDSYFSGNTIQICPVGALTSTSYRFLSRPWDLDGAQSTCSFCAVGCPISIEERNGEVLRAQALPNENVNDFWICDKGRFGHRYVSHPERLKSPMSRRRDAETNEPEFVEASWEKVLDDVATRLKDTIAKHGPGSVGFIGGSHTTNEDLFVAARFFREVVGTPNLDFRTFDAGFPYEMLSQNSVVGSSASINDLDSAETILWVGPDPKEELPVLFLRLKAAVAAGAKLVVVHPRRISISGMGIHITASAGQQNQVLTSILTGDIRDDTAGSEKLRSAADALSGKQVVVAIGQQFVGTSMQDVVRTMSIALRSQADMKLLMLVPNVNSQGAIDMGVSPHLLPGHRPAPAGMDAGQMLKAAAVGDLKMLWIMGADIATDFPDANVALAALTSGAYVVVSELFPTMTARHADVVLPAESFAEKEGSFTNLERRIQKVNPAVAAPGVARSDAKIFSDLGSRLREGWGYKSSAEVAQAIAELPTHQGFGWDALGEEQIPQTVIGTSGESQGAGWPLSWELRAVDATKRAGMVWSGGGEAPSNDLSASHTSFDQPPGFPLMLLASRSIYDAGQMVSRSPELRNVTPDPYVEVHPDEALARRLAPGEKVKVASARGAVEVVLRTSTDTPRGTASVLYDQPGVQFNALMDHTKPATFVEVSR